jgi:hypothetical protein
VSGLGAFLRARLREDELGALAASPGPWKFHGVDSVSGGMFYDTTRTIGSVFYESLSDHDGTIVRHLLEHEADRNGEHIARHDPARALAEIAAKRAILATHDPVDPCDAHDVSLQSIPCDTVRHLAVVYAGHPDYDETWRP